MTYGSTVMVALEVAAEATGWICGKRLAPFLPELIPALEREGVLHLTTADRTSLLQLSAATIDRRLTRARREAKPFGLGTTKPGSLLKGASTPEIMPRSMAMPVSILVTDLVAERVFVRLRASHPLK